MKKALALILLLVALVLIAPVVWHAVRGPQPSEPIRHLPWQIEPLEGGASRVFGLALGGGATLGDARALWGPEMQLAVVAAPGESGALEAYFENLTAGVVTGRMVLAADLPARQVQRLRERAVKTEFMDSTTRRFTLHPEDVEAALRAPLLGISFVPSAQLDEAVVLQRFGEPAERIRTSEQVEHFLYPGKGLALTLDAKGREVLQYVAPARFERLSAPLHRSAGDPAPGGAASR
ncbi:hypothetical protein [Caldimonas tepidiphila]|uniref:hypothetical protein n=1 Tax=Caldimonas tepidiphila TaxID=2315841 RepID=UPI000E5AAE68|nr:hypothetical protein [Caldimonas tepidiphila]